MDIVKMVLLQISVTSSFVCIITKILDWYNPYMDFSGHVWFMQIGLYVSVIALALMTGYGNVHHMRRRRRRRYL